MAQYEHLPIYKAAFDLLVFFEKMVKNFSRYDKYTHGTALRETTRDVVVLVVRANNMVDKTSVLEEIRIKLEELKVLLRICKEVQAFPNFNDGKENWNNLDNSNNNRVFAVRSRRRWLSHV